LLSARIFTKNNQALQNLFGYAVSPKSVRISSSLPVYHGPSDINQQQWNYSKP